MSYSLPAVAISPGVMANQLIQSPVQVKAIKLSNGSPFDVQISGFGTPGTHWIPAGTEYLIPVQNQSSGNISILPFNNNNISGVGICLITLYYADEDLPIGNWPVSIPTQTVQAKVSSVQTLSNEGGTLGSQIIDTGPDPAGLNQALSIFNDHFIWSVIQSGVLHQVLKGNTAGNPLQIGQAGDITEVLGKLTIDQLITAIAGLTITGGTTTDNLIVSGTTQTGAININLAAAPSVTGSTSGTFTIYQLTVGTVKISFCYFDNYQNGAAPVQTVSFPVGYTKKAFYNTGDVPGSQFWISSTNSVRPLHVVTALGAGGGTTASQNGINSYSFGSADSFFDQIQVSGGNGSVHNGYILVIGI